MIELVGVDGVDHAHGIGDGVKTLDGRRHPKPVLSDLLKLLDSPEEGGRSRGEGELSSLQK